MPWKNREDRNAWERRRYHADPEKWMARSDVRSQKRVVRGDDRIPEKVVRGMYSRARERAVENGREFTLEMRDIKIPPACPITGVPFFDSDGRIINSPSLDRVDNSRGYTPENVCVISLKANFAKGAVSLDMAKSIVRYIESNTEPRYDWL